MYPAVKLQLQDCQEEMLDKNDVETIFSQFGTVTNVLIDSDEPGAAKIQFDNLVSCYIAIQALNGLFISSLKTKMMVSWDNMIIKEPQIQTFQCHSG